MEVVWLCSARAAGESCGGGVLWVRLCELDGGLRRHSHAGGDGRKRKRDAGGGLSGGPEEREELLGRRRMRTGWEV